MTEEASLLGLVRGGHHDRRTDVRARGADDARARARETRRDRGELVAVASDSERREVARKLRVLACTPDEIGITEHAVIRDLGISAGIYDDCCKSEDVLALADLIDQPDEMRGHPTCEMKGSPGERYGVCTRCGAFVRRDAVTNCTSVIPVKFCPNCRAKVIQMVAEHLERAAGEL